MILHVPAIPKVTAELKQILFLNVLSNLVIKAKGEIPGPGTHLWIRQCFLPNNHYSLDIICFYLEEVHTTLFSQG